jgi:ribosomal protein S18 acetylase RimI-like enzyme
MLTVRDIHPTEIARLSEITLAAYEALDIEVGSYRTVLADVAGRALRAEVLVALDGDRLLGGVTYVPDAHNPYAEFDDPDAAGMRMLAVDPAAQGRGVGAALVAACIRRARDRRCRRLVLHTTAAMTSAQRLYRRLGFARTPWRDNSPQPHVHLLGYELRLRRVGDPRSPLRRNVGT